MLAHEISRLALQGHSEIQHKARRNRIAKPAHPVTIALAIVLGRPLGNVTPGITAL
jgi:hypothetical protein